MIDIIIPTFHRPHALERIAQNVHENTHSLHTLSFVAEPDDQETIDKVKELGENLIISEYPGSHTGAANTAYLRTREEFLLMANDDFNFHKDWDRPALRKMVHGIGVVGVSDGMGNFTPITLVRRSYIDKYSGCMDVKGVLYFPGYHHNYVDTEFANTAKKRGMWTECPESVVEHLHWSFHKAEMDSTYKHSLDWASIDEKLYNSRTHLFI